MNVNTGAQGTKRSRGAEADDYYDTEADEEDVKVEVTTGEGKTHNFTLPHTSTVLNLKQHLERDAGFEPQQTCMFVHDDSREDELGNGERLGSLRREKGVKVMISMMIQEPDAQEVIPGLAPKADLVLGDGTRGRGDNQLNNPRGVAFVPAHPDWIVTTELLGYRIKISNIRTDTLICKFGEQGEGKDQFNNPFRVAVTSDSSFVVVVDYFNHRLKILRLVVSEDRSSAHLEFVRHIGSVKIRGSKEGQLSCPTGVALLPGVAGEQETVLVTELENHRVSQFKLDGTFIRIFAGLGTAGRGKLQFDCPIAITVMRSSGQVAVADFRNSRVQIFDREGNYKRQFGSSGQVADSEFDHPAALACDVHGNLLVLDQTSRLQVFSPQGKHLCTRNDLGIKDGAVKAIAWSAAGELAVANGCGHSIPLWL
jgi:hypothetical protein